MTVLECTGIISTLLACVTQLQIRANTADITACSAQGETATRIWDAIYSQSCFTNITDPDTCTERRVFYRLISGAHARKSASQC